MLAATILGSSMAFIDGTVVNIAAPVLQRDFGATTADAQWIVQAYSLVVAALILVGGALGDRLGRRRLFVIGIVLFTVASVACGLSQGLAQLTAARVVQGIGAALLTPESLAIISASFADEKERGQAIGTWSGFTTLTAAAGPVIGGALIAAASWRYAFFLNVPIAVLALVCIVRVPESKAAGPLPRLDWRGAVLGTIGLAGLVYGFTTASTTGFAQVEVLVALALGLIALALFVVIEQRVAAPMVPLELFRSRTFAGANLFTFLLYAPLGGALFFFPFDLIQVQHYSPQAAGAALLPFILLMFALSRWSGGLVARFGARRPLVVGPIVAGVGCGLFALPGISSNYWTSFFPAMVVLGLGMAISVAPLTTTVMNSVDANHASLASGINTAVSRTASVLTLALFSLLAVAVFGNALDGRLAVLQLPAPVRTAMAQERVKLAAAEIPASVDAGLADQLRLAVSEAFVTSFRAIMLVAGLITLSSSVCALVMIQGNVAPEKT